MKVKCIYVSADAMAGHPPIRLAEEIHVYPGGTCVTIGLRTIVWQSIDFVLRAFNNIDRATLESWPSREKEVGVEPCVSCCAVFEDMKAHIAEKHAAK